MYTYNVTAGHKVLSKSFRHSKHACNISFKPSNKMAININENQDVKTVNQRPTISSLIRIDPAIRSLLFASTRNGT
jgi:hypothetical protein